MKMGLFEIEKENEMQNLTIDMISKLDSLLKTIYEVCQNWEIAFLPKESNNLKLYIYSEIVMKLRSSQILALKGYDFESVSILRTGLELNNIVLGINRQIITLEEFYTYPLFLRFSSKSIEEMNKIQKGKTRDFLRTLSKGTKSLMTKEESEIYGVFEALFHTSIHNSMNSLAIELGSYFKDKKIGSLFYPKSNSQMSFWIIYIILMITSINLSKENEFLSKAIFCELKLIIKDIFEKIPDNEDTNEIKRIASVVYKLYND